MRALYSSCTVEAKAECARPRFRTQRAIAEVDECVICFALANRLLHGKLQQTMRVGMGPGEKLAIELSSSPSRPLQ
jgi:hypothetical protein